jgi:hypothetical protein
MTKALWKDEFMIDDVVGIMGWLINNMLEMIW